MACLSLTKQRTTRHTGQASGSRVVIAVVAYSMMPRTARTHLVDPEEVNDERVLHACKDINFPLQNDDIFLFENVGLRQNFDLNTNVTVNSGSRWHHKNTNEETATCEPSRDMDKLIVEI